MEAGTGDVEGEGRTKAWEVCTNNGHPSNRGGKLVGLGMAGERVRGVLHVWVVHDKNPCDIIKWASWFRRWGLVECI